MDSERFDNLARLLAKATNRRQVLRGFIASVVLGRAAPPLRVRAQSGPACCTDAGCEGGRCCLSNNQCGQLLGEDCTFVGCCEGDCISGQCGTTTTTTTAAPTTTTTTTTGCCGGITFTAPGSPIYARRQILDVRGALRAREADRVASVASNQIAAPKAGAAGARMTGTITCPSTGGLGDPCCNISNGLCGEFCTDGVCCNALVNQGACCNGTCCTGDQVGSSRVDLQACKLEYSIVSPK